MTYIKAIELLDALQRMLDEYEQMNMEVKALRSALKEEKEKLAEMEQERDALRGALRGIQTMGIPALLDGESDYESAFRACVREAGKALEELYKTRPSTTEEEKP